MIPIILGAVAIGSAAFGAFAGAGALLHERGKRNW
jgi:hypothetical protein